ncbi:helix-turn-helix domain-containing protein [Maridesulfovibrio sp.]|uniref:helix-turn-helix domain-containing protein n=1 Tax=Maridesulfovibrio sp. TaxID=2795000 RepID=UPI002AA89A09|nr:helix-turn-helix domain-containing protein [Maridesulfovibrio sp.]
MNTNIKLINAINLDTRLKAPHKALLHALVSFRNDRTGQCNPSVESIAERAGMSRRSTINLLAELKDANFIHFTPIRNKRNSYTLYPAPVSAEFALEPIRRDLSKFANWSGDLIKAVWDVLSYRPKDSHFKDKPERRDLDHENWDLNLKTISYDRTKRAKHGQERKNTRIRDSRTDATRY